MMEEAGYPSLKAPRRTNVMFLGLQKTINFEPWNLKLNCACRAFQKKAASKVRICGVEIVQEEISAKSRARPFI